MTAAQLTISRGRASDLGVIALQEQHTLDGLANLLREAQAQPFEPTFEEYSALHAASASGDKEAKRRLQAIKAAPWFVTAAFKDNRRVAANLLECSALVGDADQPGTTRERLIAKLDTLGCAYTVSTSTSHGCGGQARYRVIIPLATAVSAQQYKALWAWLSAHMDGMLDNGAKDPTRLNYFPRVPRGALGHEVICRGDAPSLDPLSISATPAAPQDPTTTAAETIRTEITEAQLIDVKSALTALAPHASDNQTWSEVAYSLMSLGSLGFGLFQAFSEAAPNYAPGAPDDWWETHSGQTPRSDFLHLLNMARRLAGWKEPAKIADPASFPVVPAAAAATSSDEQVVFLTGGELTKNVAQTRRILAGKIFTHGSGRLVRIGERGELDSDEDMKRAADRRRMITATPEWIQLYATGHARFRRFDARKKASTDVNCPRDLAATILEQRDWPDVPELKGIQRSPFIRADGSICETAGYDSKSQIFLIPNAVYPPMPETVTREQAQSALRQLEEPFSEYPFANGPARSAFIAHILTEAARPALRTSPMFFYTAPLPGSGKTALSEWAATIVHGNPPAARQWAESQEELRKMLFASLLAGDRSIALDNIPNGQKVRSAVLSSFLTSDTMQDRKLGVSEVPTVHNGSVASASGNNITPVSDMSRRSLVIRLDSNLTQAELSKRIFKVQDLRQHVADNRVGLLMAALTILRGHTLSGHRGPTPLPSFEQWSRMVRDALLWLGKSDPLDTQAETDDETDGVSAAFEALTPVFSGREFTAQDLYAHVGGLMDVTQLLATILQAAGCSDPRSSTKLGYWLRESRDKIAAGFKLERVDSKNSHKGLTRWRFVPVAPAANVGGDSYGDLL